MSHIHIPDGVLPLWIILLGWAVTGGVLLYISRRYVERELARKLPLVGVMAALMVVTQSISLPPIGYHLNLTVLSSIILGPVLALIAAFLVNLILALFGHGGITVVGVNTFVFGTEMVLGYHLFHALRASPVPISSESANLLRQGLGVGVSAAAATMVSLLMSSLLMIGIVAASAIDPGWQAPHEPERLILPNPTGGEPIVIETPRVEEREMPSLVAVQRFAVLVVLLGLIGWPIEALITGLIARYIYSIRPDLLEAAGSGRKQASSQKVITRGHRKH